MHVRTHTTLDAEEIASRFANLHHSRDQLDYLTERNPPKCFLGPTVTIPAAAEIAVEPTSGGSDVELRLMWGPLPAPFPRALLGVGILAATAILFFSQREPLTLLIACAAVLVPLAGLLRQQKGERVLQHKLQHLLQSTPFKPVSH